ncbi:hypothetical protein ABVK25_012071 [Lepraria finkii]|uniref:dolichyl-phosphate beta-D-mannosyltransferase n=1 Tax=Lepraria finkii TaxID=1340010 RepID=A0ABR4AKY6_9LECA
MASKEKYTVILPTYNKRRNLPTGFSKIHSQLGPSPLSHWELVTVDDGSPDGTLQVAQQLQTHYTPQRIILKPRAGKFNLGTVYVDGLKYATGTFVIIMDADFSHHKKFLPQMIATQKEGDHDIITGTRYAGDGDVYGWDLKKKVGFEGGELVCGYDIKVKGLVI